MKKSTKSIMAFAMSVCLGILVACSGTALTQPSPDEVMNKITSRQKLEMADYETMLDYVEEFVEVGEDSPNDYESGQEVARAYPYFLRFYNTLDFAPAEMQKDSRYKNVRQRFVILMNR